MLEVIKDPTLPAMITEIKVGANSRIMDCLVAKPICVGAPRLNLCPHNDLTYGFKARWDERVVNV